MVKWVIDDSASLSRPVPAADMAAAAERAGLSVVRATFEAGASVDALNLDDGEPTVVRGAIGFVRAVSDRFRPHPGAFENHEGFAWNTLVCEYEPILLARKSAVVTYAEFVGRRGELEAEFGRDGRIFTKPAVVGKLFNGIVLEPGAELDDAHWRRFRKWSRPRPEDLVVVARPAAVLREARFVIADGRVVSGSLYSEEGRGRQAAAPDHLAGLAAEVAAHPWSPAACFVADIAETPDGTALVETNCFGTSGLYACDPDAVVEAVSEASVNVMNQVRNAI